MSGKLIVNELMPDNSDKSLSIDGTLKLGLLDNVEESITVIKMLLDEYTKKVTPVGSIMSFGGPETAVPEGWLLCDGKSYLKTEKSELFAVIGTYWGEPNGDLFNVPDLRGRFLRGTDFQRIDETIWNKEDPGSELGSLDGDKRINSAGAEVGSVVGSYQTDDFGKHQHNVPYSEGSANFSGGDVEGTFDEIEKAGTRVVNLVSDERGGSETRPKNAAVNYIIKY